MSKLILITGKARSGKDTAGHLVAHILERQDEDVHIMSLADPIRAAVYDLIHSLGIEYDDDNIFGEKKDEPLYYSDGSPLMTSDPDDTNKKKHASFRDLMKLYGNNLGRNLIRQDIWCKVLEDDFHMASDAGDSLIVTDVRRLDELQYFLSKEDLFDEIYLLRIVKKEDSNEGDETETELDNIVSIYPDTRIIPNNSSMDDLQLQLENIFHIEDEDLVSNPGYVL